MGNQEDSDVEYNPRYHNKPAFKEKISFIIGINKILEFIKNCTSQLPKSNIFKKVGLDWDFFDENNFSCFEDEDIKYVV